jgi:hypothetical protein
MLGMDHRVKPVVTRTGARGRFTMTECDRRTLMPKAYFVVRSIVEPPLRQRFDQWYSSHHLPMALSEFKCEKCWRFWSAAEAGVHYAAYQFADMARLDAALNSDGFKMLVTDFDRAWPHGVSRTRDRLELAEERSGS